MQTRDQKIKYVSERLEHFGIEKEEILKVVDEIEKDDREGNPDKPVSDYLSPPLIARIKSLSSGDDWFNASMSQFILKDVFIGVLSAEVLAALEEKLERKDLILYITALDYTSYHTLIEAAASVGNLSGLHELDRMYTSFKEADEDYFSGKLYKIRFGLVAALKSSKWTDLITLDSYKDCFEYLLQMCKKQARVKKDGDSQSLSDKEMSYLNDGIQYKSLLETYADICKGYFEQYARLGEEHQPQCLILINMLANFVSENGTQEEFNQFYDHLTEMLKDKKFDDEKYQKCWDALLEDPKEKSESASDRKPPTDKEDFKFKIESDEISSLLPSDEEEKKTQGKINLLVNGVVEEIIDSKYAKRLLEELCQGSAVSKPPKPILDATVKAFDEAIRLVDGGHVANEKDETDMRKSLNLAIDVMLNSKDTDKIKKLEENALKEASGKPVAWKKFTGALMFLAGVALIVLGLTGAIPTGGASLTAVYAGASLSVGGAALLFHGRQKGFSKALSNAADISKQQINKLNKT